MNKSRLFVLMGILGTVLIVALLLYNMFLSSQEPKLELREFSAETSSDHQIITAKITVKNTGDKTSKNVRVWVRHSESAQIFEQKLEISVGAVKTITLTIDISEYDAVDSFEVWGAVEYGISCCAIQIETERLTTK